MNERNVAASVRARLLNRARETQQDFSLVLTRYAIERLLYRISISNHADQFLLKGALLFELWFDIPHRPTRDADFLGFGSAELPHIESIFKDLCPGSGAGARNLGTGSRDGRCDRQSIHGANGSARSSAHHRTGTGDSFVRP